MISKPRQVRRSRTGWVLGAALALAAAGTVAHAQQAQDFSKVEIKTTQVQGNFYTLEGQGGTIGALTGPDGVFLVDTQFAPLTEKIVAAVKAISDRPIRFVVNTHVHPDHVGGNENFARLGATLLSRDQLRARLAGGDKPAPAGALPTITYDGPVTVHMNGEDVSLIPVRTAHTDGDTLVKFAKANVLMTGDFYRAVGYPYFDRNNGGTLDGLIKALDLVIEQAAPDTRIVPGHGPIVDEKAVAAHREMTIAIRDQVATLVKAGKTADEIVAAKPTAAYDAKVPQADTTAERFLRALHAELSASGR